MILGSLGAAVGDPALKTKFAEFVMEHCRLSHSGQAIEGAIGEGSAVTCLLSLTGGGGPCVGKRGATASGFQDRQLAA